MKLGRRLSAAEGLDHLFAEAVMTEAETDRFEHQPSSLNGLLRRWLRAATLETTQGIGQASLPRLQRIRISCPLRGCEPHICRNGGYGDDRSFSVGGLIPAASDGGPLRCHG